MRIALLPGTALAAMISAPAMAAGQWYAGDWCAGQEGYTINETGGGAGDHIMCDWASASPVGATIDASLNCEARYPNGDEVVRMSPHQIRVQGDQARPDELTLTFTGQSTAGRAVFKRCD